MIDAKEFRTKLVSFVAALTARCNEREAKEFPNLSKSVFTLDEGSKYIRVVKAGPGSPQRSAFCFVNKENGDILKCAGWKAPAKHARGNIFNADNGLGAVGDYGANYLR